MEKFVISISREFGSLGRPIAKKLSEILNVNFYDRDIVEKTAKQLNLPISTVGDEEEKAQNNFFRMKYPLGIGTTEMQDKVFDAQNQIILNLADKESCIIVGRCSNFILRHNKHHVSIYIYAPVEDRVKNCIESLGMDAVTARKMISKVDRARDSYNMMYTRRHPGDRADTDILINSSVLGVDGTAKILATLVIEKFGSGSQKI